MRNEKQPWTRDRIFALLMRNDDAVGRALVTLLGEQTEDEQRREDTRHQNGVGFSQADAGYMTSMARDYQRKGYLTPRQLAFLRSGKSTRFPSRIGKYARQLANLVNQKAA